MRKSNKNNFTIYLWRLTAFCLTSQMFFSVLVLNGYSQTRDEKQNLRSATTRPKNTKGAPYPAAKIRDKVPTHEDREKVPTGKKRGDMKPTSPSSTVKQITDRGGKPPQLDFPTVLKTSYTPEAANESLLQPRPLFFREYTELNTFTNTSGCCPEVTPAENGQTVMMTANTWMALSEDGGATFTQIDPTTIFPESDGGFCCDQIVNYVPSIDMFVWLLQYWDDAAGKNRIRIAAQTTSQVRSSNGTAWTYWDFLSDVLGTGLDREDMGFGRTNLWWSTQTSDGRVVVRIPLKEIAAKSTIHFQFTGGTQARHSHVTQNATNRVFWVGHLNNSQIRVYDMRDGDGFYSWRTVNINSWPNGENKSKCPDGTNWMDFEGSKHAIVGNARQGNRIWFSWLAAAGGGFPQPHVQMVKINPATWTLSEQVQVWNPDIAFHDAYLSTNSAGELGMEIAFGGKDFYASSAVGVWGDFVVYYPRLSTRCTARWGDYDHSRRATANGAEWIASGYTNEKNSSGNNIVIAHYVRFGR